MKYRLIVAIALTLIALPLFWQRSAPWIETLPPLPDSPSLDPIAKPRIIQTSILPPLPGYLAPKPVVAADLQGNVVVVAHGILNNPLGIDVLAWHSPDRGLSWHPPENLTNGAKQGEIYFDPWLETDRRGHYYLVYAHRSDGYPLFQRSKDGGVSWSKKSSIPWTYCDRPVLGVSPNGRQLAIAASVGGKDGNYSGIFISDDHGTNWTRCPGPFGKQRAIPFSTVLDDSGRLATSWIVDGNGSQSVVSVSEDRGKTWQSKLLVQPLQPDRPHPFNGERFPVLAFDDTRILHVAYVASGATKLMVRHSAQPNTWSDDIALSSNTAEEVRMAAIDAHGPLIHVTWMERIGKTWHAYYKGSRDHGKSWSEACQLSQAITLPDGSISNGFTIMSDDDQSSVRDDGRGRIHAVWRIRGGSVIHSVIEWSTQR